MDLWPGLFPFARVAASRCTVIAGRFLRGQLPQTMISFDLA